MEIKGFVNEVIRLATYALKANKAFSAPGEAKILVVDGCGLEVLTPLFNGETYAVLYTRGELLNFSTNVIRKAFINWVHGNSFVLSYAMAFLDIVKPTVVITFIDNNALFQQLDAKTNCESIKFIAIQNGSRITLSRDNPKGSRAVYHSNFFCFGNYEVDQYKSHGACVQTFYPWGSLIDSYYRSSPRMKEKSSQADICLVSEAWQTVSYDLRYCHARRSFELLMDYTRTFIARTGRSLLVACLYSIDTRELSSEIDCCCKYLGKDTMCIPNSRQSRTSYLLTDNARVVVGGISTLLREAFGRGRKVLACNYTDDSIYDFPVDGIWSLKERGYTVFEERLLALLSMEPDSYRKLSSAQAAYLVGYSEANPTHSLLQSVIAEQIVNHTYNSH